MHFLLGLIRTCNRSHKGWHDCWFCACIRSVCNHCSHIMLCLRTYDSKKILKSTGWFHHSTSIRILCITIPFMFHIPYLTSNITPLFSFRVLWFKSSQEVHPENKSQIAHYCALVIIIEFFCILFSAFKTFTQGSLFEMSNCCPQIAWTVISVYHFSYEESNHTWHLNDSIYLQYNYGRALSQFSINASDDDDEEKAYTCSILVSQHTWMHRYLKIAAI